MIPQFISNGDLPQGVHLATWDELTKRFGTNSHRQRLLVGLKEAMIELQKAGCRIIYVDGSFVTAEPIPKDFDACWDVIGVDPLLLDPILLRFDNRRAAQKIKYFGECFPANMKATVTGLTYFKFLQLNKDTNDPKGIVAVDLRTFTP